MKNTTIIALAKLFTRLAKGIDTSEYAGEHILNEDIRFALKGKLRIGAESIRPCMQSVKWQQLAVVALSHLNETTAQHCVNFALKGIEFPDMPSAEKQERVEAMVEALREKSMKTYAGVITEKLEIASL